MQTIEELLSLVNTRVKSEVILIYSEISKLVDQMWDTLKSKLSYCEKNIQLEERRTFLLDNLSLSTQTNALHRLKQKKTQLLTSIKLIPNLTSFLGIRIRLAIQCYAVASADSYLKFLNIHSREEDSIPAISLEIGVFNEGEKMVLECHSKWNDTFEILLTPFNEHYSELENLDHSFFSESNKGERKNIIADSDKSYTIRDSKLTFVNQILAHSLMIDATKQIAPPETILKKPSRQFRRYEAFLLKKKKDNRLFLNCIVDFE